MGATIRQRNVEIEHLRNTEQLFKWITQVRTKKIKFLRSRRRNIRVEAVLGHALSHAEQELRNKQVARIHKWQEMKKQMAEVKSDENTMEAMIQDGCHLAAAGAGAGAAAAESDDNNNNNDWTDELPELSSFDTFMTQLNGIKVPVCR